VFFIDYTGALCSKASGHAIDIEGEDPVLAGESFLLTTPISFHATQTVESFFADTIP